MARAAAPMLRGLRVATRTTCRRSNWAGVDKGAYSKARMAYSCLQNSDLSRSCVSCSPLFPVSQDVLLPQTQICRKYPDLRDFANALLHAERVRCARRKSPINHSI